MGQVYRARDTKLDRDVAIEPRVARPIHFTHAAGAEGGEDLVRAEASAGGEGQTVGLYGRSGSADRITLDQRRSGELASRGRESSTLRDKGE